MFGKNPIRKSETHLNGATLAVQEVFYTLQGEGPHAGEPAVFIRLAGCNLACSFCDTEFESGIDKRLTVEQIVTQVKAFPHHQLVVLTGGEPLRQNIKPLLKALSRGEGREAVLLVQIETAGTLWVPDLERYIELGFVEIVCSPKTPKINPLIEQWCAHFKYVIRAGEQLTDGLPSGVYRTSVFSGNFLATKPTIWVSPCDDHEIDLLGDIATPYPSQKTQLNVQVATQAAMQHGYRLTLQMHKLVNLP